MDAGAQQSRHPREFRGTSLASLLVNTALFAGLFAAARSGGISFGDTLVLTLFFTAIGVSQAVLMRGRNPLIAAGLVGLVWAPAAMLGMAIIDRSLSTGTLILMLATSPIAAILGAIASFFFGLLLYGVHFVTCSIARTPARELFDLDDRFRGRDWAFLGGLALLATASAWLTWQPPEAISVSSWQASERLGALPSGASDVSYYVARDSGWAVFEFTLDEPAFLAWATEMNISPKPIDSSAVMFRRHDGTTTSIRDGYYGVRETEGSPPLAIAYNRPLRTAFYDGPQR